MKSYAGNDEILQAYLKFLKGAYWHGAHNVVKNSYFLTTEPTVSFSDIILPALSGNAVGTFWYEFPDVLLPYLMEKKGQKYNFNEIEPLMVEGPYEICNDVAVRKGDTVIDCGANIGLFSAVAARKGASVFAFEPDKNIADSYLSVTAEKNGEIEVCPCALSDHNGVGYFNPNHIDIGGGRLGVKSAGSVQVKITTLDEWADNKGINQIDFIKSDIEGAERDMLKGAQKILKEYAPKLSLCTYHLPDDKKVLEQIVLKANPRYHIIHRYMKMYCWV